MSSDINNKSIEKDNNNDENVKDIVCMVCKTKLTINNTKVIGNEKYKKYKNLVCNICFNEYYPLK
ncbi:MAG: hypothetical protein M3162_08495 [Thermoproteota archaeon]|nr:hypothetical protein [Thermoproteota archaeon]